MSPLLYSLVASALLLGQTTAEDVDATRDRAIRAAVRQLGATDYATREQAYRQLWREGLNAEPALRQAAKSNDVETRVRATRLLRDFEYGVLPGIDANLRELIYAFRDGDAASRKVAFQRLVEQHRIEIVVRLIRLESDPNVRRQLLDQTFQDERIVDHFIHQDRIDTLIEAVGADQDKSWRRSLKVQLMFATHVLSRLAETGSLSKLLEMIRDETDGQARQSMLVAIFRTPGVGVVLARNELNFVLDTLRAEPDQKMRGELLGEIFANTQAAQAIVNYKQLDVILEFSRQQTDVASQQKLLERILASGPVVESLLKEGGVARVVAMIAKESDPVRRGRLLGATISSSAVRTFLQRNGLSELAIKLAKEETNEAARHEFLQALLHDTSFVYSLNDEATVAELWRLIKADANAAWRARSLIVLLQSHRSNALLRDKDEAVWILKLASDDATGPVREDILRFLLPNDQAQRLLIANGHFDTMLKLARELPIRSRGEILGNFFAGAGVAEHLVATKQIDLLISIAREEPDAAVKQLCLQGVFRNSVAMAALLDAGNYATFRDLIQSDGDPVRQATLFGVFIQNQRVVDELAKQGDSKLLLAHAASENEGARRQFLPRLFRNHRVMTLLMEQGHFDRLVVLAKQDDGTSFHEFLAVPKVIEHLAATKQFALFIDFATNQADDNTRRNLLRNAFMYPNAVEALLASQNFDRLLQLIRAERDATWRASLLGPVISSPLVVTHFAASKQLDTLLSMISDEPEAVARARLMTYLTSRSDTLGILIDRGFLDTLIAIVNRYLTGQMRGTALASIVTNTKALERLGADQRVGLLLAFTGDADADFTTAYIARLFLPSRATDLLVEHGYYADVFKIATTNRDAKVRAALFGRFLYSQKAVEQMIARGDVATLVAIIKSEEDDGSRRDYLRAVCSNDLLIEDMLKTELFGSFVETLRSDPDAAARSRQLATLVYSEKAVAELAADEQLDQILNDAIADADLRIRETWLSIVVQRTSAFAALVKLGYGEMLLDAIETRLSVDRQQSLLRSVVSNQTALTTLIEQGHFERLVASAKRHGGSQFGELLGSPIVVEYLAETKNLAVILRFVAEETDPNASYRALYTLLRNATARKQLLEAGKFETLCESIQKLPDASRQASILLTVFSNSDVTRHYVETDTVDQLFAFIEQKTTTSARSQILSSMCGSAGVVDLLTERDHFEALLRITSEQTSGETRRRLLAQLLGSPQALTKLITDRKVDSLLTHATEADGSVSVAFVRELLTNRNAVGALIDQGRFQDLYKLATASNDSKTRTNLLGQLLVHSKAIELLAASGQLPTVVNYARDETDSSTRRAYLSQLCANQLLIAELIRAELFDVLVDACESEPDVDERRRQFAILLHSAPAIEIFAVGERLEPLVEDALAEPNTSYRQRWLTGVLSQSNAFAALMKHGVGDRVLKAAERELAPALLQGVYRSMISSSAAISELAKSGQHRVLFKLLAVEPQDYQYSYTLSRIASNEDALRAITIAGELNELLDRIAKVPNKSNGENLHRQILVSSGTISALAQQDKLLTLFDLIRGTESAMLRRSCLQSLAFTDRHRGYLANLRQPEALVKLIAAEEEQHRSGIVVRLASDTNVRRCWIEAGNLATLEELVSLSPSAAHREQHLQNVYYTPSGVVGHFLRQGKFDEAESLLRKANGERAMSWLASYHTSRGQLGVEIERLRQKNAESRSGFETRLLSYLLRANGDLAGATEIAKSIGDPRLLRPLLVEQRAWAEAAALQAESPLPPPVDLARGSPQDENLQRVEQLGLLASYHRLAGDEAATKSAIAELLGFAEAHRGNQQLVWNAAQALLLNDCIDEGLHLTKDARPLVAFTLFASRHDYRAAFEAIGLDEHFVASRQWYDALPFGTTQAEVQKRFQFAIEAANTLHSLGEDQGAERVLSLLEGIIQDTPKQGGIWPTQNYLWQWYSGGLYRIGLKGRAWGAAANVIDLRASYPPAVLADIFGVRMGEARVWWMLFRDQNGTEKPELLFQKIEAVMNPTSLEAVESFPELVGQAIKFGATGQNESYWRGLADTCMALGQQERAIECFKHIDIMSLDTKVAYADILFAAERWADAAGAYHDAWLEDYDRLDLLFLAGVAKQRAGEGALGETWQRRADLEAVMPNARHQLALALTQRGLVDAANGQWKILLRTAPFESLELNDAARQLAMNVEGGNPASAAPLWQHYALGNVRPVFIFLNGISYLNVPALLHKIRALDALEHSDFEAAERAMRRGLTVCPGDTVIAEELVPRLDAVGQREIADRFVSQVVGHYKKLCETHPRSARLHNNLAWVSARCHRHLDVAITHAEKAVELEPDNAGYIDTLAEVHFHLGDRDKATEWSERAVALRPMAKSLKAQLARFRSEQLPTP